MHLRSVLIAALALLAVLWLHLISALMAGLGGFVLYRWARATTRAGSATLASRLMTIVSVSVLLLILGAALFAGFELLLSASSDGLAKLLQLLADTLDQIRDTAPDWMASRLPDSAAAMQEAISSWLRSHAGEVQHWGRQALHVLIHLILGLAIGLMAGAAGPPRQPVPKVMRLALARLEQLALAFVDVVAAQLRISLINTALTAVYLLVVLPALGYHVPLGMTLVAFSFFASLLPIIGNLLSNAAIILAALTVSLGLGVASLVFLVVIHKLEYFLNARIVGGRIRVATYALLASMLVLEAAFGVAGLIAAPIYCAWLTRELRGGKWI
ncbi:MAG TPA: AI-2E family transporter [Ramlibacter sp.]|nr:AI-2E family transporter [Ramlibacter sp.]